MVILIGIKISHMSQSQFPFSFCPLTSFDHGDCAEYIFFFLYTHLFGKHLRSFQRAVGGTRSSDKPQNSQMEFADFWLSDLGQMT